MLYSDIFSGIYDKCVKEGESGKYYKELSQKLKKYQANKEWGYLFKSIKSLCDVLEIKFDLGVRTRRLYKENNKQALIDLAKNDYSKLIGKLNYFFRAYEECWIKEKKTYGFDVQTARIGGLILRVKSLKKRLIDFGTGVVDKIPELEEELLTPLGYKEVKGMACNYYNVLSTANPT